MAAYYNEIDPKAAAWLRELIRAGHIAPGDVDERSIVDVRPDDLTGYTQCHWFAGIGVWSHGLRLAGWSDDRECWTGSPPCQPFSAAGKGLGVADERHLWPHYYHLIEVCRPDVVFGEQVASKDGLAWLQTVFADMEAADYAFGAFDLCAAGFGAPHIRQRQFFVGTRRLGDTERSRLEGHAGHGDGAGRRTFQARPVAAAGQPRSVAVSHDPFRRADLPGGDFNDRTDAGRPQDAGHAGTGGAGGGMADADGEVQGGRGVQGPGEGPSASVGAAFERPSGLCETVRSCRLADAGSGRLRDDGRGASEGAPAGVRGEVREQRLRSDGASGSADVLDGQSDAGPTNGLWGDADWLLCRDGRWRPVEPESFPLVDGAPARVGRLRGYGNAIVAPVAEGFIRSFLEAEAAGFDLGPAAVGDDLEDLLA